MDQYEVVICKHETTLIPIKVVAENRDAAQQRAKELYDKGYHLGGYMDREVYTHEINYLGDQNA